MRRDLQKQIMTARLASRQLILYREIMKDEIFIAFGQLLDCLQRDENCFYPELMERYFDFMHLLYALEIPAGFQGDAWQYRLIQLILRDDNIFSRKCEVSKLANIDVNLTAALASDLRNLQVMLQVALPLLKEALQERLDQLAPQMAELQGKENFPDWYLAGSNPSGSNDLAVQVANQFLSEGAELPEILANYYAHKGTGVFGLYPAFRWAGQAGQGYLQGIEQPDPISFDQLVGYETERQVVIDNTEKLVLGLPANNVLLYGDRGTGKSSTVKALLNRFKDQGLRLVEVAKQDLPDFPLIIAQLKNRAQKFIVFVDDLSFEENDAEYKYLKAMLEGGLEVRPENILVYATSNRRHLISERFSDRERTSGQDEIRMQDTLQEKLSLADRFGITVTFVAPIQREYLAIVDSLADQSGLQLPREELHQLAIQWEMKYNGRSGRTARQFVDWLIGEGKRTQVSGGK